MGLIGGLKGAAKGLAGNSVRFEAASRHELEFSREQVYGAGTVIENIPKSGRNLELDFGRAAIGTVATGEVLALGRHIDAKLNLSSLGKLSDVLARSVGMSCVRAPMTIEQLSLDEVRLAGGIQGLGKCGLRIALLEDELTRADVALRVWVHNPIIGAAAESQRDSLEKLLAESVDDFSTEYISNIREYLSVPVAE